ncbi:MAG: flagellar brake protein [Sarcina sp.]
MGKKSIVGVNDRVEVERDGIIYKSKIQGLDDEKIHIDIPLHNNDYLMLNVGEEVRVLSYSSQEAAVHELSCEVVSRKIEGNIRLYILDKPFKVRKIQRRNYVRVKLTRVIKCVKEETSFDVLLLDLSGGGMRVKTLKKFDIGDEIMVKISVDNQMPIEVNGKVVRIEDAINSRNNVIGVEFIDISEWEREKIIKIVFEIMRKQMELI